jgi:hypothetical protein
MAEINSRMLARFWSKVDKSTPEGCWLWTGTRTRYGYFYIGNHRMMKAHRFSWILSNGPIPNGMCILHRCDNPPCLNPSHLWIGTQAQNVQDMRSKGRERHRGAKGEAHLGSKLTTEKVLKIRQDPRTEVAIAAEYGVNRATIGSIRRRENWKHV